MEEVLAGALLRRADARRLARAVGAKWAVRGGGGKVVFSPLGGGCAFGYLERHLTKRGHEGGK